MEPRVLFVLKRDALGRMELLEAGGERRVRRVACGGRLAFSRLVARALLARERRALRALEGVPGIPRLEPDPAWARAPSPDGSTPSPREVLVRSFVEGEPLHRAERLPEDFFQRLEELAGALHARGVCHNDLHKEQNVLVGEDGRPGLIDFQLASRHAPRSPLFASRSRDDLRHVRKHWRRYTRDGRGSAGAAPAAPRQRRSLPAALWRRAVKPLYNALTRPLSLRDGEERRPSSGPWPRWTPPLGPGAPS